MNDNFEIFLVVAFIVLIGWGITHLMSSKQAIAPVAEQPKEPEVVETPAKPKRGRKKAVPAPDAPVKTKRTPKKKVTE